MNLYPRPHGSGVLPALILHGGAGVGDPSAADPGRVAAIKTALARILREGEQMLAAGASALDVVEAAVRRLEDDPLFNAGRGAALTSEATIEHDATIMDGCDRRTGAVASVGRIRNPISAARAVMDRTSHVMLTGTGAEQFARLQGLALAPPWYFFTEQRLKALERVREAGTNAARKLDEEDVHGTVGAVAIDADGRLAAATSTGGRANKLPGRVGDSAVAGAGTYADNRFCALSATGSGEHFSRMMFGHRVSNLIELCGFSLDEATARAIAEVREMGGSGGFVSLASDGRPVSRFTGAGMHRGYVRVAQAAEVAIYADDEFSPDHR